MSDKTLGAYKRTTPDPDETTGEALARLAAEMTRLLDEADAELRDEADGGVAAALIEQEAEKRDPSVDYHAMWWKAEREREKAERERDEARATKDMHKRRADEERARADAAESRPLTPDAITDEMVERAWTESQEWTSLLGLTEDHVRALIAAALTEPPARPEGAEEVEALVDAWKLHAEPRSTLPDFLAEHGVRVVTEDGAR